MSVKGGAWLLGLLLVIGMFVGARAVLDPSSATTPNKDKGSAESDQPPNHVLCWGNFDVEPGINKALYPKQFGDIKFVVAENTKVKKDVDLLLHVNDSLAQLKLKEAKLAVKYAELQLKDTEKIKALFDVQEEMQAAAIASVDNEIKEVQKERDKALESVGMNEPVYKTITERYGFGLAKLAEKKKAEVAKQKQIKLLRDTDLKKEYAEADLESKKLLVEQATEALTYYKVFAPRDGTVLRVNVKQGEALTPNPMMPALEFVPDLPIIVRAEILQEWGRYIKEGQTVEIEDDVYHGPKWEGKVKTLSKWYAQTRTPVIEPFRYNDVRTLECIIELTKTKDAPVARIGQRIRAKIKL